MSPVAAFFHRNAWIVFTRNYLAWQKYAFSSIAINIVEPLAYFLALGFGLGSYLQLGVYGSLVQFIAPGMLGFMAVNTATFDASWGCFERRVFNGVYESMVTAPVDPLEIAAGEYLWQAFRAVLYGCLFLGVITALGLVHSWWALLCPLVLAISGLLFSIPALFISMIVKTQEHLFYYFSFVVTPMSMISGVFFPLDKLPHWLATIAWWTPLYHAVNIFRSLVLGKISSATAVDVVWLMAAIAVLAYLPSHIVRKRLGN
jgi:lipooligosaccharide transport system permease protein